MTIFAIETEATTTLLTFMAETGERLKSGNIVTNPFNGVVKQIPKAGPGKTLTYVLKMEPVYPKFFLFGGIFTAIGWYLAGGWKPWLIPGLILFSTGVLWTKYFYFLFIIFGLRKAGHRKKVKLLSGNMAISRFLEVIV